MDLLDRLLGHDAWTTRELLELCRGLTDDQLDREFDLGLRTLRATLDHIIYNVEGWTDVMSGRGIPQRGGKTVEEMIARQERAAAALAALARSVAARDGWDERWTDATETPPVDRTYGGTIAHVITHSMHHRAQVLFMIRRLGVPGVPEGDVLSWEARVVVD